MVLEWDTVSFEYVGTWIISSKVAINDNWNDFKLFLK